MSTNWCYFAFNISEKDSPGIIKKIFAQAREMQEQVGKCDVCILNKGEISIYELQSGTYRKTFLTKDEFRVVLSKYKVAYYRWGAFSIDFYKLLKYFRKNKGRNVVEIPTYPIDKEMRGRACYYWKLGKGGRAIRALVASFIAQNILLNFQKIYVDYFVLISFPKDIRGKECIHIENGIDVSNIKVKNSHENDDAFILCTVANVSYWHGIDRVIRGISDYKGTANVKFLVVGDGAERENLESLTRKLKLEDKVKFLGVQTGKNLDDVFEISSMAVGTLAWHRQQVRGSSTLKSREYSARGIPFITTESEHLDDSISDFVYKAPEDESSIDIAEVYEFYNTLNIDEARTKLCYCARNKFDWKVQIVQIVSRVK